MKNKLLRYLKKLLSFFKDYDCPDCKDGEKCKSCLEWWSTK